MIDWKQKLGSRKFWALLAALAVSVLVAFGADAQTAERVTGVITAAGACAVYILAEASVDRAATEIDTAEIMDSIAIIDDDKEDELS